MPTSLQSGFYSAPVFFSSYSELYVVEALLTLLRYYIAPLDIGLIVHQIYKLIEVASLFKKGPYLEQKTTTA